MKQLNELRMLLRSLPSFEPSLNTCSLEMHKPTCACPDPGRCCSELPRCFFTRMPMCSASAIGRHYPAQQRSRAVASSGHYPCSVDFACEAKRLWESRGSPGHGRPSALTGAMQNWREAASEAATAKLESVAKFKSSSTRAQMSSELSAEMRPPPIRELSGPGRLQRPAGELCSSILWVFEPLQAGPRLRLGPRA